MCLYGQDIDENTTPVEASLESVMNLDDGREFVGKSAIMDQIQNGARRRRLSFRC